jgi:hypothetical protein
MKNKTRQSAGPQRVSQNVVVLDAAEPKLDRLAHQARWLSSRFKLTDASARLFAEIAFEHGRQA